MQSIIPEVLCCPYLSQGMESTLRHQENPEAGQQQRLMGRKTKRAAAVPPESPNPSPDCCSPAYRRELPESVQSEVKWQWWCPLPELQEAGSTRISLPLWACTQRHPSLLQKQQKKAQGLWVVLSSWGSGWRGGQKQHMCACTRWHGASQHKTLQFSSKTQQCFACQQWFPSKNLRLLCKHLEAAVQKHQKIHRNQDKDKLSYSCWISSRKAAFTHFTDLHLPHHQPHDRTSPHPLKAYPRKALHMKQELEISTTLIISYSEWLLLH